MQSSLLLSIAHMGAEADVFLRSSCWGTVLTSHATGIWCRFTDGTTVLVHDADYGSLPFGLACADSLPPGMAAPGDLVANDADSKVMRCGPLTFAYGQATPPEAAFPAFSAETVHERTAAARAFLAHTCTDAFAARFVNLQADGDRAPDLNPHALFTELWEPPLYDALTALYHFSLRPEAAAPEANENAHNHAQTLIGLGPGLTPLADDILCAWLYAAHTLAQTAQSQTAARFTRDMAPQVLELAASRTTPQSTAFLHAAARGGYFSLFADTLAGLCDPGTAWPDQALARIVRVGHSSGCGFLLGLLLAATMSATPLRQTGA